MAAIEKQIASFVKLFLLNRYDSPVDIPTFHREMWSMATSGSRRIAIAAPRAHAKSTAMTHALTLYMFLFRIQSYGFIVSDTESQAAQFLGDIKTELLENEELRDTFGVKRIVKDAVTDIIVECNDGYQFRLQALGAEQKVRGRKWNNRRPGFIICDDLENDELVESETRREKFRNWFFKALIPSLSKTGMIVVVGTILHLDSVLMRLLNNKSWLTKLYKAHNGFDDFTGVLWPEQWPVDELKAIRQEFIDDGYAEGYAQEYLNDPIAHSEAYFKKEDFLPMEENHYHRKKNYYGGIDFAISDADKSAYTAYVIGAMDEHGMLDIEHVVRMRGDADQIIDMMFELQRTYGVDMWFPEKGQIWLSIEGEIYSRMNKRGVFLNLNPKTPTKDKRGRARGIQARMRAGGVRFHKAGLWYPAFEQELLQFPKGPYKDQVDALAWLGIGINELNEGPSDIELQDDAYNTMVDESDYDAGRNLTTGY